ASWKTRTGGCAPVRSGTAGAGLRVVRARPPDVHRRAQACDGGAPDEMEGGERQGRETSRSPPGGDPWMLAPEEQGRIGDAVAEPGLPPARHGGRDGAPPLRRPPPLR